MDWPSTEAALQYLLRVSAALLLALLLDRLFARNVRFRGWLWGFAFLFPVLLWLPRPLVTIPLFERRVPVAELGARVYELEPAFSILPFQRLGYAGPSLPVALLLAATGLGVAWWAAHVLQAWRLVRSAEQVTNPDIVELVAEAAERKGMAHAPFVVFSDRVMSPCAVGLAQPYVVVPANWATDVDLDAWRTMLAHEVGHIVRADPVRVALCALVQSALWWNPLGWLGLRRGVVAMEQANDFNLLHDGQAEPKAYARLLVASATGFTLQTLLHFVGKGALLTRVESILDPRGLSRSAWPVASLALFLPLFPHYDFSDTPPIDPTRIRRGETAFGGPGGPWIVSTNGAQSLKMRSFGPNMALRAVSPDGTKVVLSGSERPGEEDLFIANTDGTDLRVLVATKGRDYSPRFSPDGKLVAFGTKVTGTWEIGVVDVATGKWRLVTKDGKHNLEPSFHPNGKRLAFTSARAVTAYIWSINLDGTGLVQLTADSGDDTAGTYSRDGRYLLYSSQATGKYEVTILDLATNVARPLVRSTDMDSGEPRWTDGDTAVVFSNRVGDTNQIERVDVDGRNRKAIAEFGSFCSTPD